MKLSANDIVLKLLGLLLLTAAVFKGYELLTEPVANADLWSNRNFMIFTVEFELALAIWLLSGLFKKLAWLAASTCFAVFCCVTLYKAFAGYGSCGCFGKVHVNPWITLLAIDLPVVVLLGMFRPKGFRLRSFAKPVELLRPLPNMRHFATIFAIGLIAIAISTPALRLNEPAIITSTYEVLEPETWVGKELPILEHIDIADQIKTGNWLLLFYHHDCPDCRKAIAEYEQMSRDLKSKEDFLSIAMIEVPPYGNSSTSAIFSSYFGKLANTKRWIVTTPAVVLLEQGKAKMSSEGHILTFKDVLKFIGRKNNTRYHNE